MANQEYKTLIQDYYDAFNQRDYDKLFSCTSDDIDVDLVSFEKEFHGKADVRKSMERWLEAIPDMKLEVENLIVSEQGAVAELIGRGTHEGVWHTERGDIAPTGMRLELKACEVFRFKNGKIMSVHSYYSTGAIERQLKVKLGEAAA